MSRDERPFLPGPATRARGYGPVFRRLWGRALLVTGLVSVAVASVPSRVQGQADEAETITLQYRVARDAFAPSSFVAVVSGGLSPPLELVWDLPKPNDEATAQRQAREKREFDDLIVRLERESLNGVEFVCTGVWLTPGFKLRVISVPRLTESGRKRLEQGHQATDSDRPTVGVLAFDTGGRDAPGADLAVQQAADRLHEALVNGLQQESAVRWSEPHENLPSPLDGHGRLQRLIVDYLITGEVLAVAGDFACEARLLTVATGEEASFTISFVAGEEDQAAADLRRQLVEAIAGPTG